MVEIKCSTNYKEFQFLSEFNRELSETHVNTLAADPTFPSDFQYHPAVVNERMEIIDGQHRCKAAEKIGIPIYYIVKPLATLESIKKCNVQQKKWSFSDYLKFYAGQEFSTYQWIKTIRDKFEIPLYLTLSICNRYINKSNKEASYFFKDGKYEISPTHRQEIHELMAVLIPCLKNVKSVVGEKVPFIMSNSYFQAFVEIYKSDYGKFTKVLEHLITKKGWLEETSSVPYARTLLTDLLKSKTQLKKDIKKREEGAYAA